MDRTNNLIANWRNKEKQKDHKKYSMSAPFLAKNAKFKGRISSEEIDAATKAFLAKGGQIQKLEAQDDEWIQRDDFAYEMAKLRRSLRVTLEDLHLRDMEYVRTEEAI